MSSFTSSDINRDYGTCLKKQTCSWFTEHRKLQATAMSVDWQGGYALLAGRRHLALQSLDNHDDEEEDMSLQKFHRNSKYEVSSAEWAICEKSQEYCAIATSQLIEVVTWSVGDPTLIHSLRAHTRAVTDIDWHSKQPLLLASCSIDTFTHLWDLRDPRKPILSLSAVCMSGATQVGFNRVSGNLLATAHDGDLRIWDQRMGSCPLQYITAHSARIHGINWSHNHETHLTTASQDGTVKYFDINNPRSLERMIKASSPVWRARYTPFADGLVTVIVPHLRHDENSLLLWNNSCQTMPICSFVGHTDVVLDFAFRPNRADDREWELVTWSRDQTLRIWKIDEKLQKLCTKDLSADGIDEENNIIFEEFTNQDKTKYILNRRLLIHQTPPSCSLQHEFSLLNTNIPHIDVLDLDPVKRLASVRISANGHVIMLEVTFPQNYPSPNVPPDFSYCPGTSLDDTLAATLMRTLKQTAHQRVKKGKTCLEQCLRALVTALKKSTSGGDKSSHLRLQSPRLEGALSGALHDACVPFPKTSGAKFCSAGLLVVFAQPLNTKRISLRHQTTTPRALSALSGGYLGNVMGSQPVLYAHRDSNSSAFYLPDRARKNSRHRPAQKSISASVSIYDLTTRYMYVSRELAEKYVINTDNVIEMCKANKLTAENYGRDDVAQAWCLAEMIATPIIALDNTDEDVFSSQNPFAKNLLESLIMHFAKIKDVQTAAMLICAFGRHCPPNELYRTSSGSKSVSQSHLLSGQRKIKPSGSPYHTILPLDPSLNQRNHLANQLKQFRSNSWSDSDDLRAACGIFFSESSKTQLLGDNQRYFYDNLKKAYADLLHRWGLLVKRAKVLKYLSMPQDTSRGVDFVTECITCGRISKSPFCNYCHHPLLFCALCRLPVRGAANSCLQCGHGGHTVHMRQWFEKRSVCAAGCGCECLAEACFVDGD